MSSLDTWNNAKSIVQKLLGPQATLPKFRVDLAPEIKAMIDGRAEFYKAIDGFLAASTKSRKPIRRPSSPRNPG